MSGRIIHGDATAEHFPERVDGLTEDEGRVADLLYEANCAMADLPVQHADDMKEFEQAIHVQQGILALRIARRHYPGGWTDDGV